MKLQVELNARLFKETFDKSPSEAYELLSDSFKEIESLNYLVITIVAPSDIIPIFSKLENSYGCTYEEGCLWTADVIVRDVKDIILLSNDFPFYELERGTDEED